VGQWHGFRTLLRKVKSSGKRRHKQSVGVGKVIPSKKKIRGKNFLREQSSKIDLSIMENSDKSPGKLGGEGQFSS